MMKLDIDNVRRLLQIGIMSNYNVQIAMGPERHQGETLAQYMNRGKKHNGQIKAKSVDEQSESGKTNKGGPPPTCETRSESEKGLTPTREVIVLDIYDDSVRLEYNVAIERLTIFHEGGMVCFPYPEVCKLKNWFASL
jgi:hypothetical protein